jgi:hypothetical protein
LNLNYRNGWKYDNKPTVLELTTRRQSSLQLERQLSALLQVVKTFWHGVISGFIESL